MLMKQLFNHIGISTRINFANALQLFMNPCNIFHCVSRSKKLYMLACKNKCEKIECLEHN